MSTIVKSAAAGLLGVALMTALAPPASATEYCYDVVIDRPGLPVFVTVACVESGALPPNFCPFISTEGVTVIVCVPRL